MSSLSFLTKLAWDSKFFKFPVFRCDLLSKDAKRTGELLQAATYLNARLVYWQPDVLTSAAIQYVEEQGGQYLDQRVDFSRSLLPEDINLPNVTRSFGKNEDPTLLADLAVNAGWASRFARDKILTNKQYYELYKSWINRSVSREFAKDVLIIENEQKILGLITLKQEDRLATIGLVSVEASHQGTGLGRKLLEGAIQWAAHRGCSDIGLATQNINLAAVNLYSSMSFEVVRRKSVFHFWI